MTANNETTHEGNCFEQWGRVMAKGMLIRPDIPIDWVNADSIEDEKTRSIVRELQARSRELKHQCFEKFLKERIKMVFGLIV